jgi:hypothetical protein
MSIADSGKAAHPTRYTVWHVITAISITLLVVGEFEILLSLGEWAAARLLGLPGVVTLVLYGVTGIASVALAVVLFMRVMRVEARLAANQSTDDIGWHPFKPNEV